MLAQNVINAFNQANMSPNMHSAALMNTAAIPAGSSPHLTHGVLPSSPRPSFPVPNHQHQQSPQPSISNAGSWTGPIISSPANSTASVTAKQQKAAEDTSSHRAGTSSSPAPTSNNNASSSVGAGALVTPSTDNEAKKSTEAGSPVNKNDDEQKSKATPASTRGRSKKR
jgi:hypothetical protein